MPIDPPPWSRPQQPPPTPPATQPRRVLMTDDAKRARLQSALDHLEQHAREVHLTASKVREMLSQPGGVSDEEVAAHMDHITEHAHRCVELVGEPTARDEYAGRAVERREP